LMANPLATSKNRSTWRAPPCAAHLPAGDVKMEVGQTLYALGFSPAGVQRRAGLCAIPSRHPPPCIASVPRDDKRH
jgi:hypothetical protein